MVHGPRTLLSGLPTTENKLTTMKMRILVSSGLPLKTGDPTTLPSTSTTGTMTGKSPTIKVLTSFGVLLHGLRPTLGSLLTTQQTKMLLLNAFKMTGDFSQTKNATLMILHKETFTSN